jgi:hypothetical protein
MGLLQSVTSVKRGASHHPTRQKLTLVAVFLIFRASSSFACLNDTSIKAAEDEFRSRYEPNSGNDTSAVGNPASPSAINPWGVVTLAVGSGLIAGASIVGFRRHKRQDV